MVTINAGLIWCDHIRVTSIDAQFFSLFSSVFFQLPKKGSKSKHFGEAKLEISRYMRTLSWKKYSGHLTKTFERLFWLCWNSYVLFLFKYICHYEQHRIKSFFICIWQQFDGSSLRKQCLLEFLPTMLLKRT